MSILILILVFVVVSIVVVLLVVVLVVDVVMVVVRVYTIVGTLRSNISTVEVYGIEIYIVEKTDGSVCGDIGGRRSSVGGSKFNCYFIFCELSIVVLVDK